MLFLAGMLVMAYNVFRTGRRRQAVEAPIPTSRAAAAGARVNAEDTP